MFESVNIERLILHLLEGVLPQDENIDPEGFKICRLNLLNLISIKGTLQDIGEIPVTRKDSESFVLRKSSVYLLFVIAVEYGLSTGAPLLYSVLSYELQKQKFPEKSGNEIIGLFQALKVKPKDRQKFLHQLDEYCHYVRCIRYSNLIVTSSQVFREHEQSGLLEKAFSESYSTLSKGLGALTLTGTLSGADGYIQDAGMEILERYVREKKAPPGMPTGMVELDKYTRGQKASELMLIGGYTGQGKSVFLTNDAIYKSTVLGKNVFLVTAEMSKARYEERLVCRHSRNQKFSKYGNGEGIDLFKAVTRTLSPDEEDFYAVVVEDLTRNSAYGKIYIHRCSAGVTIQDIGMRLDQESMANPFDMVLLDYLQLIRSSRRIRDPHEDLGVALIEAKELAMSFGGKGIAVTSAWQISREGWNYAKEHKEYDFVHFSGTSGAERTADVLVWVYRDETLRNVNRAKYGLLKNRDGIGGKTWEVFADYATQYLASLAE